MLLWGSLFPIVKLGYRAYDIASIGDILFFAGLRFTVCGIIICVYSAIADIKSYATAKSAIIPILLSGVFAIILHYGFTYCALHLTESSKTAILKQSGVLFYVCFSSFFFKDDKLTAKKLIGVIVGFAGIIAINLGHNGISFNLGDLLVILASFCTVISNIISKKVLKSVTPSTLTGISQLFGGAVLLAIGKIMGGTMHIGFNSSVIIIVYICIASVFSYCLWFTAVKNGKLSNLFIIKFAEPVFACIFGALLLGENILNIRYIIAFILIAAGIYISNK